MNNRKALTSRIMGVGIFAKIKVFSEWLKLHIAYSRLDHYNHLALSSTESGIADQPGEKDVIVTLTTYGHRIHSVHLVIESLLRQTVKPNRIILWLSKSEFCEDSVPEILKHQRKRGLQIEYCEDMRSYKKLIPTLALYPNGIFITADDDIVFPHDHVERLYKAHLKEPQFVHCNRAHLMRLDNAGGVKPYKTWEYESSHRESSMLVFPTTGMGAIYTREHFDEEVSDSKTFSAICPHADDIWLKLMTTRCGTQCKIVPDIKPLSHYLKIPDFQGQGLIHVNRVENDEQLSRVLSRYPDIIGKLRQ